jgi:CRP-like cAMP-binding protein
MNPFSKKYQCLNCEHCFMKSPLFQLLNEEELELLNSTRVEVSFKKDEIIYKQGMPLTHLVILREGIGKIYIEGTKDRSMILCYTKAFELNGGIGVFADQIHHSSLVASQDCETCFIDLSSFKEVLNSNKDFRDGYLHYFSEKTRQTYHQLAVLTQKNMEGRMAESLLYLKNEIFKNGSIRNVSKQDLADFTAMSKESAIRVIKEFKTEGYVEVEKQDIIITNEEALRKVAAKG